MAEREKETDRYRPLFLLHQFAGHIVDRGDMICIDGVAQPKSVRKESRSQERRFIVKSQKREDPRTYVDNRKQNAHAERALLKTIWRVVDHGLGHAGLSLHGTGGGRSAALR